MISNSLMHHLPFDLTVIVDKITYSCCLEETLLKKAFLFFGTVLLCFISIPACNQNEQIEPYLKNPIGFTDTEVLLGSSLALKGHASFLGTQTLRGAMCYIKYVNEQGGVHGRRINIIAYDDSYDPPQCVANTQRLIIEDRVFALFSYVGTPTTIKILPMVDGAKIPILGMFTGANALREPFNRYIVNVRASYYQETGAAVKHLVEDLGIKKIAVLYQYDAYGFDGLTGTELALKEYGLAPVASGSYIRGTFQVGEALNKIVASEAEAVVMIGTAKPCAEFITGSIRKGVHPVFYTPSFAGSKDLAQQLGPDMDAIVIMSQVVPPPEGIDSQILPGKSMEYASLLKRYYPKDEPNFVGFEGYINAKVLVEGLKRAGRKLTRERFIDAIESINGYPIGYDITISFSPTDHQGMDRVYFTRLENGRFELITEDWATIKNTTLKQDKKAAESEGS